jgi:hypothetical protein
VPTRGVVHVHSTPLAACADVERAITRALTVPVSLRWSVQPLEPAARRAELDWTGPAGTGARIAGELRHWPMLRFEVAEEPSPGVDGERFMHVPGRGLFRAAAGAAGDIRLGEDRLRALAARARGPAALAYELEQALGTAWDEELEPYRHAGEGAPVTALPRVG